METIKRDMADFGLVFGDLISDGQIHRCKSTAKSKKNQDGWYVVKEFNGKFYGNYGCWIRGESRNSSGQGTVNNLKIWEELKQIQEYEREEREKQGKIKAQHFITECVPAAEHPYLSVKKIKPYGILQNKEQLIIPCWNKNKEITSYQTIDKNGKKKFMYGGLVGGSCFPIIGSEQLTCVCEGLATGASIAEATGFKVLIAFNAGNLGKVADQVIGNVLICADNDWTKKQNTGVETAKNLGYNYVFPTEIKGSDFNDMASEQGLEAVRDAIIKGRVVEKYEEKDKEKIEIPLPTGILKDIAGYYNQTAIKPQPLFAVATGLMYGSVILGRRYKTDFDNYTSNYFLLIAKSGTGKDHPKTVIRRLLSASNLAWLERGGGFTAANTVVKSLGKQPLQISFFEEIGQKLCEAANHGRSNASGMFRQLLDVWSSCHSAVVGDEFSDGTVPRAKKPALTIVGLTTPREFFDKAVNESLIEQGFINRLLPFISNEERTVTKLIKKKNQPLLDKITAWTHKHLPVGGEKDELRNYITDPGDEYKQDPEKGELINIPFTNEAVDFLNECEKTVLKMSDELEKRFLEDMPSRMREITMRISLIYCLMNDCERINTDHTKWSWQLIKVLYDRYIANVKKHLSGSDYEKMKMEALKALRKKPVKPRDMPKTKPFSKWDKKTRTEILLELQDAELVDQTKIKTGKRGAGTLMWTAVK